MAKLRDKAAVTPSPGQPSFVRILRARPRLFVSAMLGLVVIAALWAFTDWTIPTRLLTGWDVGVGLYLILAIELMARSDVRIIRRRAAVQDDGRIMILIFTAGAGLASLVAIVAELGTTPGVPRTPNQLGIAIVTIVLSWAFIHFMFALHYAHEYYADAKAKGSGMDFPGDGDPDYWDFLYFSLVIGMTSQVSDVAVTSKSIRNTVGAHGVVSFFFNVTLLALMVNIAASAL